MQLWDNGGIVFVRIILQETLNTYLGNFISVAVGDYKKLADEELVYRYVHRNEQAAFTCLFERYGHLVYGVCLKYLKDAEAAKDAMQQIFIKLLDDLKRFQIETFKPWLYQVAKNYCFMQLRKTVPVVDNKIDLTDNVEFDDDWHHKMEKEELLDKLETAIEELNEEQRRCIKLFYLDKLAYAEIAAKTGYSMMQVKSAIQNGKRNLKLKLETSRNVNT
ncbi:MAG: sigma-70 family RNA polymerase sigma factor [Bacteroidetes bacterium]|nr:sigma-70 family RNA polymerase sigma factor [Bacteroidota bacterium]